MSEDNDKTAGGFSRKIPHRETHKPQVKRSGVNKPVRWKKEWSDPDYVETYEERRPRRHRGPYTKQEEIKLGTMEPPKAGDDFSKEERNLLKKLKEKNKK